MVSVDLTLNRRASPLGFLVTGLGKAAASRLGVPLQAESRHLLAGGLQPRRGWRWRWRGEGRHSRPPEQAVTAMMVS